MTTLRVAAVRASYLLGCENVRVYDGSWAERGRMTGTPVERP